MSNVSILGLPVTQAKSNPLSDYLLAVHALPASSLPKWTLGFLKFWTSLHESRAIWRTLRKGWTTPKSSCIYGAHQGFPDPFLEYLEYLFISFISKQTPATPTTSAAASAGLTPSPASSQSSNIGLFWNTRYKEFGGSTASKGCNTYIQYSMCDDMSVC